MTNDDLYEPCPCGSGKKYKFCCLAKARESAGDHPFLRVLPGAEEDDDGEWVALDEATIEAGKRECGKGLKLMGQGKFRQAIPCFRKALERTSVVYVPANNLALCLYVTGKLDEAISVQEKSLAESPLANPFGLANLATFRWIRGDEEAAEAYIEEAMDLPFPSEDTCIKICEVLARFKRHKTILEVVDACAYRKDPAVCFFTGVAAANLVKRARAEADLKRVSVGYHKAEMARRYLRHLQEKSTPHTVMGDWPYLFAREVCPQDLMEAELKADEQAFRKRRILVQFTEALLNEGDVDAPEQMLEFVRYAQHPDANAILWAIVKGSFGPDELRSKALSMLLERGAIQPDEPVEMLVAGKRAKVQSVGVKLNPEFRFGGTLSRALDKIYVKAITDGQNLNPDWEKIGKVYQQVMRAAPDFYPVRYNYAITLVHRQRYNEAEPILRKLYEQNPDYLFAAATLVQLCMVQGRDDEAKAIIDALTLPAETHPAAMVSWMITQHLYAERQGDHAASDQCLAMVRELAPDHPILQKRR